MQSKNQTQNAPAQGLARFKNRMQNKTSTAIPMPLKTQALDSSIISKENIPSKSQIIDSKRQKSNEVKEKKEKYVVPSYLKKAKISTLLNKSNQFTTKGVEVQKEKEDKADVGHQGATAGFAVKETFDAIAAIKAKLESAERRQSSKHGKGKKVVQTFNDLQDQSKQEIAHEQEDDDDEQDVVFRKPMSGKSSRGKKGKESVQTIGSRGKISDASNLSNSKKALFDKTPSQKNDQNDSDREDEYLLDDEDNFNQTPSILGSGKTRMGSTDEQGNRFSNMPGENRESLTSVAPYDDDAEEMALKVESLVEEARKEKAKLAKRAATKRGASKDKEYSNLVDKIKDGQDDLMKSKRVVENGGKQLDRNNFVKTELRKTGKYKPALRGAAFSAKIMAKKSNQMKFRGRMQAKILAEKAANSVGAYGGLGAHGLDFGADGGPGAQISQKEVEGSFSGSAMQYAPKIVNDEDMDSIESNHEEDAEQIKEANQIEQEEEKEKEEVIPNEIGDDKANYPITDDNGYLTVLKERFGHEEFREGQMKAIKLILEQKKNAMVVLATGGGKSLCYQFVTQFLPGLILVVTPLISLMTDQLQKLPDFIPGAALNSQQSFATKQAVIKAVQEKKIKVIFITPERLFMEDLSKFGRKISMVCVDEIHCASEWSHNFRPAYLVLHEMIKEKLGKECRVIGLTATATRAAQEQICNIFDIKYPDHIVTQTDLSRMNLQLSITRDNEKTTALLTLLRTPSFKKLTSILLFATTRATTDRISQLLNQNGIKSASYHAGKMDDVRAYIQKEFIENRTRVLCCTIAFSMGIDKSDIQSVIHYDLPRSIENYVQEIGRAGRDGNLARCHMFLNDDDFYQLRRITLSDLLDNQSSLRMTNVVVLEAKKQFCKQINKESGMVEPMKKRKRKDTGIDNDEEIITTQQTIEEFEKESEIKRHYSKTANGAGMKFIELDQVEEMEGEKLYVALNTKALLNQLDLKKEVVLTMLDQLEKLNPDKAFFRVDSILPVGVQMRFHSKSLDSLADSGKVFYQAFRDIATNRQGIYRCNLIELSRRLKVKPYNVPKMLYGLQHSGSDDIAYDLDNESFILEFYKIPHQTHIFELSEDMLAETRRIEKNLVSKLNCMYFAARKISLPSVDFMLRKERELDQNEDDQQKSADLYLEFSAKLNNLINKYFQAARGDDIEIKIAGTAEERADMMPLLYVTDTPETKNRIEDDMRNVLCESQKGEKANRILNPSNRMKPLDVVKVLMGIFSSRESVTRFKYDGVFWGKLLEYDYEQLMAVAEETVNGYYLKELTEYLAEKEKGDQVKKRKLTDLALE